MALLQVDNLQKRFGNTQVLKGVSFSLERGQVLTIIGSSGSGKTTLLRCLNFLELPDQGSITVGDQVLFDGADHATLSEEAIRQNRLHFGLVFQNFNLFPQYNALENITLAVCPNYNIHTLNLHNLSRFQLGIAACYSNYGIWVLFVQLTDSLSAFFVCMLGNTAGIYYINVCRLALGNPFISVVKKLLCYG